MHESLASSMASPTCFNTLRLSRLFIVGDHHRNIFHAQEVIYNVGFFRNNVEQIHKKNLIVKAGSSSFRNVDMVNGKKVNGVNLVGHGFDHHKLPMMVKMRDDDIKPVHDSLLGRFVEERFVYRQTFIIRSYEIGPDKTATMETLMNLLQETALNHVAVSGLAGNGFGATREMSLRKLIWVVTRISIQVDRYSSWGDIVEIDTWVDAAGKNGMRRDWIIRDYKTQTIITRATSKWVIMDRETRRLTKIPPQVKEELLPFYLNRSSISMADTNIAKIDKLTDENAGTIRSGLAPRWSDMDANQHVNNVKYIGWILESVPINVLEKYHLTSMTLEYRRECRQSNLLESLTSIDEKLPENSKTNSTTQQIKSTHLLRMQEDKAEIVRARSEWQLKT